MKNDKTVIINGQEYDAATGLPLMKPTIQSKNTRIKNSSALKDVRSLSQKTHALYNRAAQKTLGSDSKIRKIGRSMDVARSKSVSHFATATQTKPAKTTPRKGPMDIGPMKHPLAGNAEKIRLASSKSQAKSNIEKPAKTIKEEAIAEALSKSTETTKPKRNFFKRRLKFINILGICVVLLLISGYFVYLYMPSISVGIASAQAGIKATYPEYHPDGYSLRGPVTYSDGEVVIDFRANAGNGEFVIKQSRSSWDSSAVKEKIDKDTKGEFTATEERGLTIYAYDGNATWVNGGILYTISGDAPLSGDQIRRIATSL